MYTFLDKICRKNFSLWNPFCEKKIVIHHPCMLQAVRKERRCIQSEGLKKSGLLPLFLRDHIYQSQERMRTLSRMVFVCLFFVCKLNPLYCFFGSEDHVALDRNPGPGYDTLLLWMIPGDLLSAFPHRQFHTLPGLLDSWAALPNSYPNALRAMQGGSLYHFHDGLWYDPAGRRTHYLPCERRTRYRLSQQWMVFENRVFCL